MGNASAATSQIRTRRRSADLRAIIVVSAEATFSRLGYKGATMSGIAQHAGVTRSVLTRHFATKAELFAEVMTKPLLQFVDEWTQRWTSRLDSQPPEPQLVHEFIADLYRNSRAHVGALRLLMFSDDDLEIAVRQRVWMNLNEGLGAVLEIANREIGSHGYSARNVDVTVRALISMVMGYVTMDQALLPTATTDPDEVVTHLASLILYGLTLQPPRQGT